MQISNQALPQGSALVDFRRTAAKGHLGGSTLQSAIVLHSRFSIFISSKFFSNIL